MVHVTLINSTHSVYRLNLRNSSGQLQYKIVLTDGHQQDVHAFVGLFSYRHALLSTIFYFSHALLSINVRPWIASIISVRNSNFDLSIYMFLFIATYAIFFKLTIFLEILSWNLVFFSLCVFKKFSHNFHFIFSIQINENFHKTFPLFFFNTHKIWINFPLS